MEIHGEIKGIKYKPFLCRTLERCNINDLNKILSKKANFILKINDKNEIAVSWWVSPKRTRSYPYARVYDTLGFTGKKVTIIPVIKDEGKDGDRDFLQWDTISLMSLLGIYVIIGYYAYAEKSLRYPNKITKQKFDVSHIKKEIQKLLSYQSDALHWNLEQVDRIYDIARKAFNSYVRISKKLGVEMHSMESAQRRIEELRKNKERFMELSRELAHKAQVRESITTQPKEYLTGVKATITIKNYLGGYYYFTCDEAEVYKNKLCLIEAKHTKTGVLPSESDIKDGLIKMILFTNLKNVAIDGLKFEKVVPILKLTTSGDFQINALSSDKLKFFNTLKMEAKINRFKIKINKTLVI